MTNAWLSLLALLFANQILKYWELFPNPLSLSIYSKNTLEPTPVFSPFPFPFPQGFFTHVVAEGEDKFLSCSPLLFYLPSRRSLLHLPAPLFILLHEPKSGLWQIFNVKALGLAFGRIEVAVAGDDLMRAQFVRVGIYRSLPLQLGPSCGCW